MLHNKYLLAKSRLRYSRERALRSLVQGHHSLLVQCFDVEAQAAVAAVAGVDAVPSRRALSRGERPAGRAELLANLASR